MMPDIKALAERVAAGEFTTPDAFIEAYEGSGYSMEGAAGPTEEPVVVDEELPPLEEVPEEEGDTQEHVFNKLSRLRDAAIDKHMPTEA